LTFDPFAKQLRKVTASCFFPFVCAYAENIQPLHEDVSKFISCRILMRLKERLKRNVIEEIKTLVWYQIDCFQKLRLLRDTKRARNIAEPKRSRNI
jgi:hypothetical protein